MPALTLRFAMTIVALASLCLQALPLAAQDNPAPRSLAFNEGFFSGEVLQAAVDNGTAETSPAPGGGTLVRHVWVEQFEVEPGTTTLILSIFESCESTFTPALEGGSILSKLEIAYVPLDYAGRPVGAPTRVKWDLVAGTWSKTTTPVGRAAFEASLTPFALERLRRVSGQLDRYPGYPVAEYAEDLQATKFGRLLGIALAPVALTIGEEAFLLSWVAAALSDIGKDQFKTFAVNTFVQRFQAGTARWGRSDSGVSAGLRLGQKPADFASVGKEIWPGFGVDLNGAWESQDPDARFRLEINGARVTWLERSRNADEAEFSRTVVMTKSSSGPYKIERPVDEGLARFQFNALSASTVLAAHPGATALTLTPNTAATTLTGSYVGVRLSGTGAVSLSAPALFQFKKVVVTP